MSEPAYITPFSSFLQPVDVTLAIQYSSWVISGWADNSTKFIIDGATDRTPYLFLTQSEILCHLMCYLFSIILFVFVYKGENWEGPQNASWGDKMGVHLVKITKPALDRNNEKN